MRKVLVFVSLAVLAAAIVAWLLVGGAPPVERVATDTVRQAAPVTERREAGPQARTDPDARAQRLRERAAERAVMRARITEALAERAAAQQQRPAGPDPQAEPDERARRTREPPEAETSPPGQMIDRTGNRPYLARVLSEELIPLADECYQQARERKPELAGMMVFSLDIVGDEEVGGVVDSAAPAANNELADPGLIECVRESLLATTLPPPKAGGRDSIEMSLRFSPDEDE